MKNWRYEKAKEMIRYYKKQINRLKKVNTDWAKNEIIILQAEIESYYTDFPELRRLINESAKSNG